MAPVVALIVKCYYTTKAWLPKCVNMDRQTDAQADWLIG